MSHRSAPRLRPGSARPSFSGELEGTEAGAVRPVTDVGSTAGAGPRRSARSTTRSQAARTTGRWLTTIALRPASASGRAVSRADSVSASTPSVGSSSSRRGRSVTSARASATRRCWPVDRPAPRSPIGASRARSTRATSAARRRARSSASGAPRRMLSATLPATSTGRWGTHAIRARHASSSRSSSPTPPTEIRPRSGRRSPMTRSSSVDLPAPLGPRRPTVSPGPTARESSSRTGPPRPSTPTPSSRSGTREGSGAGRRAPEPSAVGVSSTAKTSSAAARPSMLSWKRAPTARSGR